MKTKSRLSRHCNFETQSTLKEYPRHLAIIMDGNRRWAASRGRPAIVGHRAGVKNARDLIEHVLRLPLDCVTLFAFASANWRRSKVETNALLDLAQEELECLRQVCHRQEVCIEFIGRRDNLPADLLFEMSRIEAQIGSLRRLRIAIDYSSRAKIFSAAKLACATETPDDFANHVCNGAPPVDLLVRTGGYQRLSDFLLWECAFAELYFTKTLWPDFNSDEMNQVFSWFFTQTRNYGS